MYTDCGLCIAYTCELCSTCRLYDVVRCCGKLESFGLQHPFPAVKGEQILPDLPSSLTALKLSVREAEGALVLRQYKQLKELDLEFANYPDWWSEKQLISAIMEQRISVLHEVSLPTIMTSSFFVCLE